nr:helix-turn-helix domain-containing protein [Stutzerimonas kunmingensis]
MAAFSRKDYETRRERQAQGIRKAKGAGLYKGRRPDLELQRKIYQCLDSDMSVRKTADLLGCSTSTVSRHKRERDREANEKEVREAEFMAQERRAQLGLELPDSPSIRRTERKSLALSTVSVHQGGEPQKKGPIR